MHKPLSDKKIKDLNKEISQKISNDLEVVFLLQDILDPINVGSFFRTADAFGAELILTENTPTPPDSGISLTARGLERSVPWTHVESIETAIQKLHEMGFKVFAVELSEASIDYSKAKFPEKIALLMGNEATGVYKKVLELCDETVHIPMRGKGLSLNVNIAGAIVAAEVISQYSK